MYTDSTRPPARRSVPAPAPAGYPAPSVRRARRRRHARTRSALMAFLFLLFLLLLGCLVIRFVAQRAAASVFPDPAPVQTAALFGTMEDCTSLTLTEEDLHTGALVLVNNQLPAQLPAEQALLSVYENKNGSYKVKDRGVRVAQLAMEPLNQLMDAFCAATGLSDINVISGFRDVQQQQSILEERIAHEGEAEAARWVAQPGHSEHHTGLAVDLSIYHDSGLSETFQGQRQYGWVAANCAQYGFILRYTEEKTEQTGIAPEPWHFRYVGAPHAAYMMGEGLCLEEYIELLRSYRCDGQRLQLTDAQGEEWQIWYVPATGEETQVPVPKDKPYTVSGDNVSGFVVTVSLG